MITIELVQPTEGETTWRIRLDQGAGAKPAELPTAIGIAAETDAVIMSLHRMWPKARIKAPCGQTIYPRPPGELPRLSSHQL